MLKHPVAMTLARREFSYVFARVVFCHLCPKLFGIDPVHVISGIVERTVQLPVAVWLPMRIGVSIIACGLRHVSAVRKATIAIHANAKFRKAVRALQAPLLVAQVRQIFWTEVARNWANLLDRCCTKMVSQQIFWTEVARNCGHTILTVTPGGAVLSTCLYWLSQVKKPYCVWAGNWSANPLHAGNSVHSAPTAAPTDGQYTAM